MQPLPGATVAARGRRHLVLDVADHGECRSVLLAPVEARLGPLTLIEPFDRLQPIEAAAAPRRAGRRRVARACAAAVRLSCSPGSLHAATDARIDILPYQLEPALALLRGTASRILLADAVGLGKTIQAGLVLAELKARHRLVRALVLTPAGLRDQWEAELRDRFGIEAVRLDAAALGDLQRAVPPWVNAWTLPGVVIASIDLLKRPELIAGLEHAIWDLAIVDEAHHASRGTDRRAAAALVCSRSRLCILITATPHTGDEAAFNDLRLLGSLPGDPAPATLFRRTRAEVTAGGVAPRVRTIRVRRGDLERRLDAQVHAYTRCVWRESAGGSDARLAMVVLRKRALSGPVPLARSLARRLAALSGAGATGFAQLALDFDETIGGELIAADDEPAVVLGAPGLADGTRERALLTRLLARARAAAAEDSKAAALVRAIGRSREPVIVFTEYRDTLADLRERLDSWLAVAVLHGGLLPSERVRALDAFTRGRARILLATDAAAEGLNLHHRCRWLIHYEVPWSATRVAQRNGRVDRMGQQRRVHVWHLVAVPSAEPELLSRLASRSAAAARVLADEREMATALFEGTLLPAHVALPGSAPRTSPASAEASRLLMVRRLPPVTQAVARPQVAEVRRRGAFHGCRRGTVLGVFVADAIGPSGHRVAAECVAARAPSLAEARRLAGRRLGRRVRRAIAVHQAVQRRIADRQNAIAAALRETAAPSLQPSLFDRRALADADHRAAECRRALDELAPRGQADGTPRWRVTVRLAGAFVVR